MVGLSTRAHKLYMDMALGGKLVSQHGFKSVVARLSEALRRLVRERQADHG